MRFTGALVVASLLAGCEPSTFIARSPVDAAARDAFNGDAEPIDASSAPGSDAGVVPMDASAPSVDAWSSPLGPPLARPPAGPPDHAYVIDALAGERPDLLASSCVAMGGSNAFLFEAVTRLRAIDARYGLVLRGGAMLPDRVGYYWGDGAAEGSSETYVVDIIARHCARPGIDAPAGPSWGDDSAAGGTWTIAPLAAGPDVDAGVPAGTDASMPPTMLPLPDGRPVVNALAAERPDLLASSCVSMGGNNEFLFELVRRLRAMDVRWGLNWKRGVVGDMSQDAITYYYGPGDPVESATDVYIIDVIGSHCGSPSPAFTDVTEATRLGGTIGRWTLAGRTDLGP